MEDFSTALELRQRVERNILSNDVKMYGSLINNYKDLFQFVELYIQGEASLLGRAWQMYRTVLTRLTKFDIQQHFEFAIRSFHEVAEEFAEHLQTFSKNIDNIENLLNQMVLVGSSSLAPDDKLTDMLFLMDEAHVSTIVQSALTMQLTILLRNPTMMSQMYDIPIELLPVKFYPNETECGGYAEEFTVTLGALQIQLNFWRQV